MLFDNFMAIKHFSLIAQLIRHISGQCIEVEGQLVGRLLPELQAVPRPRCADKRRDNSSARRQTETLDCHELAVQHVRPVQRNSPEFPVKFRSMTIPHQCTLELKVRLKVLCHGHYGRKARGTQGARTSVLNNLVRWCGVLKERSSQNCTSWRMDVHRHVLIIGKRLSCTARAKWSTPFKVRA